jgi:AGCS family alanine or glycine:cation symporter
LSYNNPNGIEITLDALNYHLGNFGTVILIFAILSFAFSTVISGYYYGESNLKYLDKNVTPKKIVILNIFVSIILLSGAVASPKFLWDIVDIGAALLAIINTFAMLALNKKVINEFQKERSN